MTLQQAVGIYAICARAENKSPRTVEWVTGAARRLGAFLGDQDVDIASINTDLVRHFIFSLDKQPGFADRRYTKHLARPVSPETRSCYVRGLKTLFARLVDENYITDNPMAKIKTPKVPTRDPVILTEKEITQLFGAIRKNTPIGFRDYTVFLTLLDTGIRVSELCGLAMGDVDLDNGYLRVMGKGSKERFVPVGYKLTKVLLKYSSNFQYRDTGSSYFFITKEGHPLNRNRVVKLLRDYARKGGINGKRVHPHAFRSTKAVLYLRHGGDPFSLQKCLGHASLTMTRRYSSIGDADVKSAHVP